MNIPEQIIDKININNFNGFVRKNNKDHMFYYSRSLYIKYIYILSGKYKIKNDLNDELLLIYHTIFHNIPKIKELCEKRKHYHNIIYDVRFNIMNLFAYYAFHPMIDINKELSIIHNIIDRSYRISLKNINLFIRDILSNPYNKLYIVEYLLSIKLPYEINLGKHYEEYEKLMVNNPTSKYYIRYEKTRIILFRRFMEYSNLTKKKLININIEHN